MWGQCTLQVQRVQRGGLGFIGTAGVLQPEGRPFILNLQCPLELGNTVPQLPVHDFILGNNLFPSGYSLTRARTL